MLLYQSNSDEVTYLTEKLKSFLTIDNFQVFSINKDRRKILLNKFKNSKKSKVKTTVTSDCNYFITKKFDTVFLSCLVTKSRYSNKRIPEFVIVHSSEKRVNILVDYLNYKDDKYIERGKNRCRDNYLKRNQDLIEEVISEDVFRKDEIETTFVVLTNTKYFDSNNSRIRSHQKTLSMNHSRRISYRKMFPIIN